MTGENGYLSFIGPTGDRVRILVWCLSFKCNSFMALPFGVPTHLMEDTTGKVCFFIKQKPWGT